MSTADGINFAPVFAPVFWGMSYTLTYNDVAVADYITLRFCHLPSVGPPPCSYHYLELADRRSSLGGITILQAYIYFYRFHDRLWIRVIVSPFYTQLALCLLS